jgi:hypothetical protein
MLALLAKDGAYKIAHLGGLLFLFWAALAVLRKFLLLKPNSLRSAFPKCTKGA